MNTQEFFGQFESLDGVVDQLSKESGRLEASLNAKKAVQQVLAGLKSTPQEHDPGKYGPAFYFVERIGSDNIQRSDEPSLYRPCPQCQREQPVVMKYEQTFDSPDFDQWAKEALVVCPNDGAYSLARFVSDDRF